MAGAVDCYPTRANILFDAPPQAIHGLLSAAPRRHPSCE